MKQYVALFLFISLGILGCDAQVERNIERLKSARDRLEVNPKDEEALATILKLLTDSNGINRSNAAAVLGQAGEKVGGSIKEKALPPLIQLLGEGDGSDKGAAAQAISRFGVHATEAIPVLRKSMFPSTTDAALYSARALGKIGEPAAVAVPDLLRVIEEKTNDPASDYLRVGETAARSLGQIGHKALDVVPRLTSILDQTKDDELKIQLAVAIMRIDPANSSRAVKEIEALMRSPNIDTRVGVMMELTDAGAASWPASSVIKAAAQSDSEPDVRGMAQQLLNTLEKRKQ